MIIDDYTKQLIEEEIKGCFDFFWYESNAKDGAKGYGMTADVYGKPIASTAAVGFAFCAYVIGVERGYITFDEGFSRVMKTLHTLKSVDSYRGFWVHFMNQETLESKNCEYSTIDTAILLMGAIVAGEYFAGEVKRLVNEFVENVDWEWLITTKNGKKIFRMAYSKEVFKDNDGWCKATWEEYAEQLMMYILYAGQSESDEKLARELYFGFERRFGGYKGENLVYCFGNALFIHQFTHCFFDFRKYVDSRGFDWFKNSINATLANRQFCIDQKWSKTYGENAWGLTAFEAEDGYKVLGAPPFGWDGKEVEQELDGSVPPYAALTSIVFTPEESIEALKYYASMPELKGKYGFTDCFNFEKEPFFSKKYLGIDKGPTIVMLENFMNGTIWKYFMQSDVCQRAIKVLNFKPSDEVYADFTRGNSIKINK